MVVPMVIEGISVLMPLYNHEQHVKQSIESVLSQRHLPAQLIVIDDSSQDESYTIASTHLKGVRNGIECILLRNDENRGICWTLNRALLHATGEYVALLASDDIWLEEHLSSLENALANNDNAAVAYADAWYMDEGGQLTGTLHSATRRHFHQTQSDPFECLLAENPLVASGVLIRRRALLTVGAFDEELVFEDFDLWLRLASRYQFVTTGKPTLLYRLSSASLNSRLGARRHHTRLLALLKHAGTTRGTARRSLAHALYREARWLYRSDEPPITGDLSLIGQASRYAVVGGAWSALAYWLGANVKVSNAFRLLRRTVRRLTR